MPVFKNIKSFLTFSKSERLGIALLLIIISVLAFCPYLYNLYFLKTRPEIILDKNLLSEISKIESPVKANHHYDERIIKDSVYNLKPFFFNPNNISDNDWLKLGLKAYQIKIIKNYTQKGGIFKTKKDVLKIYSIKSEWFSMIKPFILLPDTIIKENPIIEKKLFKRLETALDINVIDSSVLEKLPGIGPYLAGKIIKYRNKLGGFYNKNQILEINGMRNDLFVKFENKIDVLSPIRYININSCKVEELENHPYLKKKLGNILFQYIKQRGKIYNANELSNIPIMKDSTLIKLKPYLRF
jgi:competence protein ComEA